MASQYDIDRSQELQDRGIKKEFQTMRIQQVEALMMNSKAASSWHD
jgi:hypothetical protein